MLIDRDHRAWAAGSFVALIAASACYYRFSYSDPIGPTGGSPAGLIFGIAGTAAMIFAGLISARKTKPAMRVRWLGTAQFWLRGHIWLGLLSVPLILFHAGFALGGGLETVLMAVFFVIIASGVLGVVLQQVLPRAMMLRVPRETFFDQVPQICALLQLEADATVAKVCGPLAAAMPNLLPLAAPIYRDVLDRYLADMGADIKSDAIYDPPPPLEDPSKQKPAKPLPALEGSQPLIEFYRGEVRPFLAANPEGASLGRQAWNVLRALGLQRPTGGGTGMLADRLTSSTRFAALRSMAPADLHAAIDHVAELCEERRQLATQIKFHHWLHGWLVVHVPLSMALLVLAAWHVVSALYY